MTLLKNAKIAGLIVRYLLKASLIKLTHRDRQRRLRAYALNASRYSRKALEVWGFEIHVEGFNPAVMAGRPFLIVSNHMSYLDALILASIRPGVFVTSEDMGENLFLGTIAEMAGSIFVERRHRERVQGDKSVMARTLANGHDVIIYPEGTSTDGERVLPFKKTLLMAAQEARVDILPVLLRYTQIDGEAVGKKNHQYVCWYGDMTFFPHFVGLAKLKKVKVTIRFLEPIQVGPDATRDELSLRSHQAITLAHASN